MFKLVGTSTLVVLSLLFLGKPHSDRFSKYKQVEAYEVRPGILMLPTYSDDGQVCEIGLQILHYSPEMIRLDSGTTPKDVDEVLDELVPASERGPKSKVLAGDLVTQNGPGSVRTTDFENVTVQIVARDEGWPTAKKRKTVEIDVVATVVHWKNRTCSTR